MSLEDLLTQKDLYNCEKSWSIQYISKYYNLYIELHSSSYEPFILLPMCESDNLLKLYIAHLNWSVTQPWIWSIFKMCADPNFPSLLWNCTLTTWWYTVDWSPPVCFYSYDDFLQIWNSWHGCTSSNRSLSRSLCVKLSFWLQSHSSNLTYKLIMTMLGLFLMKHMKCNIQDRNNNLKI